MDKSLGDIVLVLSIVNWTLGFGIPQWNLLSFNTIKKEIYKLKNQSYALYCHASCGPTFGGGHDYILR